MWKRSAPSSGLGAIPVLGLSGGDIAVMTYTSASDKMKVFSAFVGEGLENGDMVDYTYPDEESTTIRAKLRKYGINVEKCERNGALLLKSLTQYYLPDGNFDKESVISRALDMRLEAKREGYKHYRDIEDIGDFSFLGGQWQKFIECWDSPRWGTPLEPYTDVLSGTPFVVELAAFDVEGLDEAQRAEIIDVFRAGKPSPQLVFVDLLEYKDAFSRLLGMPHHRIVGSKVLLQFDPTSNYERVVDGLVKESMANVEPIFVYTFRASPIHTHLAEHPTIRFFLTSVSTSVPKSISKNEMLLPAMRVHLILDTISKSLKIHTDRNVCFVFDILSELLTLVGREKTFSFLRHSLDLLSSSKATCLFLLNTSAHEPHVISQLRSLFPTLLTYEKNGLKVMKMPIS
jgi:hypothetical protein